MASSNFDENSNIQQVTFLALQKLFQVEAAPLGRAGDKGKGEVLGKIFLLAYGQIAFLPSFGQFLGLFGNLSIFPYYKMASERELNLYL